MSLDGTALRKLAALGLNSEQMAGVLDVLASMTDAEEARRAAQRERTRKFREKIKPVTLQSQHGNGYDTRESVARGLDNSLSQKIEPQESKKEQTAQARDLAEFTAELTPLLDDDRLKALLKHRRAKKAANTGHAGRLFVAAVRECGISMPEAVDICISRNWITVKPDWISSRSARGSPDTFRPKPNSLQAAIERRREIRNADEQTGGLAGASVLLLRDGTGR